MPGPGEKPDITDMGERKENHKSTGVISRESKETVATSKGKSTPDP
jgi:hypothetical protein